MRISERVRRIAPSLTLAVSQRAVGAQSSAVMQPSRHSPVVKSQCCAGSQSLLVRVFPMTS